MATNKQNRRPNVKSKNINPIVAASEDIPFGTPRIIFRRINGRVVPIINKRQVGLDLGKAGKTLAIGSALGLAAVGAKRIGGPRLGRKARAASVLTRKAFTPKARKSFKPVAGFFSSFIKATTNKVISKKSAPAFKSLSKKAKGFKILTRAAKGVARNPLKILTVSGIAGVVASGIGFDLQAESRFGARF